MRRARALVLGLLVAGLAAGPAGAAADVRRVESDGRAWAEEPDQPTGPLRDAALQAGIRSAVYGVALELLSGSERLPVDFEADSLASILGDDPMEYTTRFRLLRDQGLQAVDPASIPDGMEVVAAYAVRVEVYVDEGRVRRRLERSGLLAPRRVAPGAERTLQVVLQPLDSYPAYAWLQEALRTHARARRVVPLSLERGRAVLEVTTSMAPDAVARALRRAAGEGVRFELRALDAGGLTVAVALTGAAPGNLTR